MAYAKTVTVRRQGSLGWVVTITETGATTSAEAELVDTVTGERPPPCRLMRCIATRSAGTGATRQPRLGTAAAATAIQTRYQATATAVGTTIDERLTVPIQLEAGQFHRSQFDAGADNDAVTVYHLVSGWT